MPMMDSNVNGNTPSQFKNRYGESSESRKPNQLKSLVIKVLLPLLSKIKVEESFFKSPAVEAVLALYSQEQNHVSKYEIEVAIKLSLFRNERLPNSMEIIQELEYISSEDGMKKSVESLKGHKTQKTNDDQIKISLLEREHQYLMRRHVCVTCQTQPREIVSLPCGHVTQCKSCSYGNSLCPACGKQVVAEADIYLA